MWHQPSVSPAFTRSLTAADVPGEGDSGANRHDETLFPSEVLYHHQPVAWVLGESLEAARRGAAGVIAKYIPLPAILTIEQAIAAGSFHTAPAMVQGGAAQAIAAAPHRLSGELHIGGQEHFYLETQNSLAWIDESGGVALHSSTQHPSETQAIVARVLGIAEHRVTVECLRMGGAFGGKEVQANPVCGDCGARGMENAPARARAPAAHSSIWCLPASATRSSRVSQPAIDEDGVLLGLDLHLYSDGGWSLDLSEPILWRAIFHADNAYRLRAFDATGYICRTNKTSQTAFRGFGGPQGMVVIEDVLDRIARSLNLPPEVVRERNFYREGDSTHYGMPVKDAGPHRTDLERTEALERFRPTAAKASTCATPHSRTSNAASPSRP